jgi:hypothetical protein
MKSIAISKFESLNKMGLVQHFDATLRLWVNTGTVNVSVAGGGVNANQAYNLTPDELSAKGSGSNRELYNYVSVNNDSVFINTPADSYRPDKIDGGLTVDQLQQKRMDDINKILPRQQPLGTHI